MNLKPEHTPVTLLHDGDLLDDLLQVGLYRNLLDGHNLPCLLIVGLEHTAIGPDDTQTQTLWDAHQRYLHAHRLKPNHEGRRLLQSHT